MWQQDVETALSGLANVDVSFFYPISWSDSRVAVSYYQADRRDAKHADDAAYITLTDIHVDTWGKNPAEVAATAEAVAARLSAIGFYRTFSADLFENAAERHHRAERYEREE